MTGPVEQASTVFSESEAVSIAELVVAECPDGISGAFARTVLTGAGGKLILYTSPDGGELYCGLVRPGALQIQSAEGPEGMALSVNGVDIPAERFAEAQDVDAAMQTAINDELLRQEAAGISLTERELAEQRQR